MENTASDRSVIEIAKPTLGRCSLAGSILIAYRKMMSESIAVYYRSVHLVFIASVKVQRYLRIA